ncbi:MAG: twin-arginine translocase TatA/TatE family subunit [Dehalococcoidia bacterium]
MFGSLGAPEIIIIALVVILLFGVGKISGLGREVGSSIKEFRKAVKDEDKDKDETKLQPPQAPVAPPAPQHQQPPQQQYTPPPAQYQQPVAPPPQQQPVAPQGDGKNIF